MSLTMLLLHHPLLLLYLVAVVAMRIYSRAKVAMGCLVLVPILTLLTLLLLLLLLYDLSHLLLNAKLHPLLLLN
jgi:hypothetical protein